MSTVSYYRGQQKYSLTVSDNDKVQTIMNLIHDNSKVSENVESITLNVCGKQYSMATGELLNCNDRLEISFKNAETLAEVQLQLYK